MGAGGAFCRALFPLDSKFWQTLKTLFTKPGALTVAYWEKKRNRYIPPISLYIFVSVVFFLLFFTFVGTKQNLVEFARSSPEDSARNAFVQDSINAVIAEGKVNEETARGLRLSNALSDEESSGHLLETVIHQIPKLFFFMIPVMAAVLKLLFIKRKTMFFVDHAIFSLHIHAFTFILCFLFLYPVPEEGLHWRDQVFSVLQNLVMPAALIYLAVALHTAYRVTWWKSGLIALTLSVSYLLVFAVVFITVFLYSLIRMESALH